MRRPRRRRPCGRHRASAASSDIDFVVVGPEAPLVAGLADDLAARRDQGLRPVQGGGAARRLQGLHQGLLPEFAIPTAAYGRFTDARLPPRPTSAAQKLPIVVKADGLAAGKGVVIAETASGRRAGRRCLLRRRVRRGRRRGRDRGVPRRRGGELLRACRRRARAAARHGAGPQARRSTATRAPTPAAWAPIRRRR